MERIINSDNEDYDYYQCKISAVKEMARLQWMVRRRAADKIGFTPQASAF